MSIRRMSAIAWRYILMFARPRWLAAIPCYAAVNMLVFGLLGLVPLRNAPAAFLSLIAINVLWQSAVRVNESMSTMLVAEFYDGNMSTLCVSPLRLVEWITASICVAAAVSVAVVFSGTVVAFFVFGVNVLSLFVPVFVAALGLFFFGACLGLLSCALLVTYGKSCFGTTFVVSWIIVPLVGVYFPISMLPVWAQTIARVLPPLYITDFMRMCFVEHIIDFSRLLPALCLNVLWFAFAAAIFAGAFSASKRRGLVRLESSW